MPSSAKTGLIFPFDTLEGFVTVDDRERTASSAAAPLSIVSRDDLVMNLARELEEDVCL
jgi:hypothetical protein